MRCSILLWAVIPMATCLTAQEPGAVVFSELMWMGSSTSSADEWIELYNQTDRSIDLAGWTITRQNGDGDQVMLQFDAGQIASRSIFLIANFSETDPRSQLSHPPHLVSSAVSLPNNRLQLKLYSAHPDENGRLIDTADDGIGAPLAGDATAKKAMVRIGLAHDGTLPSSWRTATQATGWDAQAVERGTPGQLSSELQASAHTDTALESDTWGTLKEEFTNPQ